MSGYQGVIPGNYKGRTTLWIGDTGGDPPHWEGHRGVPPPGGLPDHMEATTATILWELVFPHLEEAMRAAGLEGMETYTSNI